MFVEIDDKVKVEVYCALKILLFERYIYLLLPWSELSSNEE